MKKINLLTIMLVLSLVLPLAQVMATTTDGAVKGAETWYIIEFEEPALAAYAKAEAASVMMEGGKLNASAPASQAYINRLKTKQAAFSAELVGAIPGTKVARGYQIVLNALAVKLPNADLATIKKLWSMPGVASISPQVIYTVDMDYSLPLIDAEALWAQLGGRENAGQGVKVAVIDSGIDPNHPLFDGTGWSYPAEGGPWPKGDASLCNGKIIAARYYPPTFAVNAAEELTPQDYDGHGSHTAGTAAGNIVTATYGIETQISGVAPGAWVMAYKGLFLNVAGDNASGSNIMLAGAIEDAVKDGADVVNNSWGSSSPIVMPQNDPLNKAYEAAADAGLVIVFSAGNSGPGYNTTGVPSSPKFIEVGASTTMRAFYNTISVTAPEPVSDTLKAIPGQEFHDLAPTSIPDGPIGPLPYIPCDLEGMPDTALEGVTEGIELTEPYVNGWIALIPRGTYDFSVKLDNAIANGASGVIMYTDAARTWKGGFTATDRDIYAVMIANDLGLEARDWWETYTDTAEIQIGYPFEPWVSEVPDVIADFSSRGPGVDLRIVPDVVAPGVNILSGNVNGTYQALGGTSMAAPHVAGAAALLKELHPDWTPAQVKSALMTTADQVVADLDSSPADVMTQGSGRLDLGEAGDPGLTLDMPSLSVARLARGTTQSYVVEATSVSAMDEVYELSVAESITATGSVTITAMPLTFTVPANASAWFTVEVEASAGALLSDLEGSIVFSGTEHVGHIPYWVRITPPPAVTGEVLLIDMDFSLWPLGEGNPWGIEFGNYRKYYTEALDKLGVTYDLWDATYYFGYGAPSRAVLDNYDKVILFTGDYFGAWPYDDGSEWGLYAFDFTEIADDIRNYLAGGGKMLVSGEDAAGIDGLAPWMRGADDLSWIDGIFPGEIPQPSIVGMEQYNFFLKDIQLDLGSGGDGAGNQDWVDELDWVYYADLDTLPLFEVSNSVTGTVELGIVATRSSYEPTLERMRDPLNNEPVSWRVAFLGFGLEGINDDTGYATRAQLMGLLLNWLDDVPTVTVEPGEVNVAATMGFADFSASLTSSKGIDEAAYYAWDFGDGSDIEYTLGNEVSHQYWYPGVYTVYAEAMDEYGHTAISAPVTVNVAISFVHIPMIMR